MQYVKFYVRYMKVMLEVFGLKYVDVENNFTNWKVKEMLKEVIIGELTPFQMYKFYLEFEIVDTNMWSHLSFEQASNLIEYMANNNT